MTKHLKMSDWDGVDPKQVLVVTKERKMVVDGEVLSDIEIKNLQDEVKSLKNFRIWRIMQETVKHKAVEKGFIESLSWEQTLSGKMMLHNLGLLRSIVEVIDNHFPLVPPPKVK